MSDRNNQTTYKVKAGSGQKITTSAASAPAAAIGTECSIVRLCASQNCWVSSEGAAAVGGVSSFYLPAGVPEYLGVDEAAVLNVIQDTTAGFLNIVEMSQ